MQIETKLGHNERRKHRHTDDDDILYFVHIVYIYVLLFYHKTYNLMHICNGKKLAWETQQMFHFMKRQKFDYETLFFG